MGTGAVGVEFAFTDRQVGHERQRPQLSEAEENLVQWLNEEHSP